MICELTTAQVTDIVEGIEAHRAQERTLFWSQIDPLLHTMVVEILDNRADARRSQEEADAALLSFDAEEDD